MVYTIPLMFWKRLVVLADDCYEMYHNEMQTKKKKKKIFIVLIQTLSKSKLNDQMY